MSKWIGLRFGMLEVVGDIKLPRGKVRCDCGEEKTINLYDMKRGRIISCGCYKKQLRIDNNITHNLRDHRLYSIWANMKTRCYNPRGSNYDRYGGRGITICDEWLSDFKIFYDWSILNNYSDELTIDRINNDGDYEPSNCRWTTMQTQSRNRSDNKIITLYGKSKPLCVWCEEYKINYNTVQSRLDRGWSEIDSITISSEVAT